MANLVNPKLEVTVKGAEDIVIAKENTAGAAIYDHLFMDFDITKDKSTEPNTAEVTLYNVGPAMLAALQSAENQEAPIEIRCTASNNTDELVLAYGGEIIDIHTEFTNPGHATHISCESQIVNHRRNVFAGAIAAGTPKNEIIEHLISGVALPTGNIEQLDTVGVIMSQTFMGVAYLQLADFVYDMGLTPYITDGVLHVTSVYQPVDFSVFKLTPEMMLGKSQPRNTTRTDEHGILQKTVVEATYENPYDLVRERQVREKKAWGSSEFEAYDGIDKLLSGIDCDMLLQPVLNPDQIVIVDKEEYSDRFFRVQSVTHTGDNQSFDDWTTHIEADSYEDTGGDIVVI